MAQNELIQWTAVALIVLGAIIWAAVKVAKIGKNKDKGCSCCSSSEECKAKEIRDAIRDRNCHGDYEKVRKRGNCHDGQSARNL